MSCEVCGKPVREGLRFCSGLKGCFMKEANVDCKISGCEVEGSHVHKLSGDVVPLARAEAKTHDPVNHPSHYVSGGVETIVAIEAWGLGFNLGNAVKYISRAGKKDPAKIVEDLKKAEFYLKREIANLEKATK